MDGARNPREADGQRERARGREGEIEGGQWNLKRQRMLEQDDDLRSAPLQRQPAMHARGGGGGGGVSGGGGGGDDCDRWPSRSARAHGFEYEDPFEASGRIGSAGVGTDHRQGWTRAPEGGGRGGGCHDGRVGWGMRDQESEMGGGRRGWDRDSLVDLRGDGAELGVARGGRGGAEGARGGGAGPRNDFISGHDKLRQDVAEKNGRRGAAGVGALGRAGVLGVWQLGVLYSSSGASV